MESLRQAQNKPKRRKNKTQTTAAHQPESYELQEYLDLLEITNGEIGTTPTEGMVKENEFQNYLLKTTIVETGTISSEGMDNPVPKALEHFSNQGKILNERKSIQENNIMKEATLEMTLKLQGGMKEDATTNADRSIEERNMRRKHCEIGDTQISDDPEYIKR